MYNYNYNYIKNAYKSLSATAMINSCRKCNKEMEDKDSVTPLLLSVKSGKAKAVRALIKEGCNVNTTDKEGRSAVYWAVREGHMDVLQASLYVFACVVLYSIVCMFHTRCCVLVYMCDVCL